ncbi:MAG: dimethylsulfoniopropionate demethylase [Woeseia sp.]|jgi:dimethylsulfoniopropionate demethylase|nr:dimethylsulfoniopropionate demethylase [Woeseia sp.]MBT6210820.1 dimethylsulfoniopropionate demethylase [Woeseia sp.]
MSKMTMLLSRRLRPSPFEQRVLEHGATEFTLYNKMILPLIYSSYAEQYTHLCEHVQIWDVACERQVEIVGPDALKLVELITPREMGSCAIGQCKYAPLCDENGGIINDPIALRLAEDRFWLSIADSDVNLWVKGIAYGRGFDVKVFEPDVSPLAIQGPKANDLVADVVGEHTRDIKFFWFTDEIIAGTPVKLARSGWSGQGGFEIYLQDSSKGNDLWDLFWEAGKKYNLQPGAPNLIERIETGLKSYGADMTIDSDPFEAGFESYMDLDKDAEYMCREALAEIAKTGPEKRLVNLFIEGEKLADLRSDWSVLNGSGDHIGVVTSQAYSPRYEANLAFAIVDAAHADVGNTVKVDAEGVVRDATIRDARWREAAN